MYVCAPWACSDEEALFRASDSLKLEVETFVIVNHHVQGTEARSSSRAASTLKHGAISSDPHFPFQMLYGLWYFLLNFYKIGAIFTETKSCDLQKVDVKCILGKDDAFCTVSR